MGDFLNSYTIPPLISSLAFFALGIFVFLKNKKESINKTFLFVCLATFWWQFSWYILFSTRNELLADYLVKIGYVGIVFIPITFYHFFVYLTGNLKSIDKFLVRFFYVSGVIFVFVIFTTNYLVNGFYSYFWGFYPRAGSAHPVYLLFLALITVRIFYFCWSKLKETGVVSSYKYYQIKYALLALIFYVIAASDFIINYGIEFYPLGFLFISIFLIIFAYAIVVHRLMDIKLALRRSIVYLLSVFAVAAPASGVLYLVNQFAADYATYASIAVLIAAVSVFSPIRDYYYRVANKYFFSSLYDSREVIARVSDGLRSTLEIAEIYNFIAQVLMGSLHAKAVSILNYNSLKKEYAVQFDNGFAFAARKIFPGDINLEKESDQQSRIIVVEEIKSTSYKQHKEIIDLLLSAGVAAVVPLNVKNEVLGAIFLGAKESGDMYNDEDLRTLETIASQAAMAIKNAQLYEEAKGFSLTLQREVERQTRELKQANEDLTKLDKAKSDFISIASHQLRTPLTAIKGFASMILEGSYGRTTKVVSDKLEKIYESAERLIRLVNDLLDLSHMEGGKMEFNFEKISLTQMVKSVAEELDIQAQKKKLKLTVSLPEREIFVKADEQKLRQVVMNLIDNAVKYTEKGKVDVAIKEMEGKVLFSVKDTGMGMKPEELTSLFQKFVRGSEASHYHTEGAGIGLYVARQLIEAHQGRAWAESAGEGQGSTFFVEMGEWQE
jgi:signal transduction histidine kinase